MIWANLLHLSYNMWCDRRGPQISEVGVAKPYLRCDRGLWNDITQRMSDIGMNMVLIDVGDAVQFSSHPEIAVEGAWATSQLKDELSRLRDMGLEPIPKLNFSAAHDMWLKEYARMVSTPQYYEVCRDLIAETAELFGGPRLFHLGMDEEDAANQRFQTYAVIRQHDLWWHDLSLLADAAKASGARPWVWSDYLWNNRDIFLQNMSQEILQSNWYYGSAFENFAADDPDGISVESYNLLEEKHYDQIPTGSNFFGNKLNFADTVKYCKEHIAPERLKGFLMTPWVITQETFRDRHFQALQQVQDAMKIHE